MFVDSVYQSDGMLHKLGVDEQYQQEMQHILAYAQPILNDAPSSTWQGLDPQISSLDLLNLNIALLSGNGNCNCSNCPADGAPVFAVFGIIALALSSVAIGILTGYQSCQADAKLRQKNAIEEYKKAHPSVAQQCDLLIEIKKEEHTVGSLSATMSSLITAGLVAMTVAAIFAALASFYWNTAIPSFVSTLAIAGGATVSAGLLGHAALAIYRSSATDKYRRLLHAIAQLEKQGMITPLWVLRQSEQQQSYLKLNGETHVYDGGNYQSYKNFRKAHFQEIKIPQKKALEERPPQNANENNAHKTGHLNRQDYEAKVAKRLQKQKAEKSVPKNSLRSAKSKFKQTD